VNATNLAEAGSLTGDLLAANSPLRSLLSDADQIGAIYRLADFDEALIITNDKFVRDANGVPLHAFILAAPAALADPTTAGAVDPDDEEVILMRVVGTTPLPQENDLQYLRAQAGIDLVTEDGREAPRSRAQILDPLTEDRMQTAGLRCAVLGTFWDADGSAGPCLDYGADIDNVYASSRLRVYKPHGESLRKIVSFMAEQTSEEPRRPFEIGKVRYASTRRRERNAAAAEKPVDVPVSIDIADLVAHKTAVLGMTRKGKSNTNKVIAATTHQYAREHGLTIGQLIFDPAAEYANVNTQDKTALAEIGPDHVVRYRLGATDAELAADRGLRSLALNFFAEDAIGVVWSLVGDFVLRQNSSQYVQSFVAADVEGPGDPQTRDDWRLVKHARRARMMLYACFLKAGLQPPADWAMWCPLKESLRNALVSAGGRRGEDLAFLNTVPSNRRGDSVKLNAQQLLLTCEALAAQYHGGSPAADITDWVEVPDHRVEHIIDVLLERKGGGYKILLPLREGYHSPTASDDYAPAVYADLVDGKIVIVDLSRGSEGVLQFASERILNVLLGRAAERFRAGQPPHRIQVFLEEAHRLFDRDRFADQLADRDPYVRLAREAGKYKIGMIYSTQQVSSVEPDVLDNTANWIIAHLNSESEVRLLRGRYEFDRFAEQILRAEDVGFVRIKTQSSRFVVPVQVRMFDEAMVAAAREATPRALEV
jgi:Helicase HerA, central domain